MRTHAVCAVSVSLAVVLIAPPAWADAADDQKQVEDVAHQYLAATTGEGSDQGRELLLGGVTMTAQLLSLDNAKIVKKEPVRHEEGSLASAIDHMHALDTAGHKALAQLLGGKSGSDLEVHELTKEEATKIMAPTKQKAKEFTQALPVMAYAVRVDKEVYWHPKNPMRALLKTLGKSGKYVLDLYLFRIQSLEGPNKFPREWPLRVLRLRTATTDTGWKVLPASDWSLD